MTSDERSISNQLQAESQYLELRNRRAQKQRANPVVAAAFSQRDKTTGQLLASTGAGGQLRLRDISNTGLPQGRQLPSVVKRGQLSGFSDARPAV